MARRGGGGANGGSGSGDNPDGGPRFGRDHHDPRKRVHAARGVRQPLHQPPRAHAGGERRQGRGRLDPALQPVERATPIFYNGPGTGEAYVEDIADNDVRSEGMSYGMMIALQLNHQTEFDALWTFVKNHMGKSGNTIDWQVEHQRLASRAPAERPTATSGLRPPSSSRTTAGETPPASTTTATEAQKALDLVRTTDFNPTHHLVRYYSGTDSNGTDASYMLPAFYQTWACFDTANAAFWNKALDDDARLVADRGRHDRQHRRPVFVRRADDELRR